MDFLQQNSKFYVLKLYFSFLNVFINCIRFGQLVEQAVGISLDGHGCTLVHDDRNQFAFN
jgi:hypothetical protein